MERIVAFAFILLLASSVHALPVEPLEIGDEPQYLFDLHVVDNHWPLKMRAEAVQRVFHQPVKHEANPLIPGVGGYTNVVRDDKTGAFHLLYQTYNAGWRDDPDHPKYAVAYARSADGLTWELPKLGLVEWQGGKDNNIVFTGMGTGRGASGNCLVRLPEDKRHGHRYWMTYSTSDGIHVIGSDDMVHWDEASDVHLQKLHSDTCNSVVYDEARDKYVMFCRAKHIYRTFRGDVLDTGMSRRIARMEADELFAPWTDEPQTILVPDEVDLEQNFTAFYGMPVYMHGGMYWGFAWPFKFNTDIYTELMTSRDGVNFQRLPGIPRLLDLGPEGAWDDGMVFASAAWADVGNQWWTYYAGWDGGHGSKDRTVGIGLARIDKGRIVGLRGSNGGGVICTRRITWPGGDLVINADAASGGGNLTVRISDADRRAIEGYDHGDCQTFTGNSTDHVVTWSGRSLDELKGQVIRLEVFVQNAELFTFRAASGDVGDGTPAINAPGFVLGTNRPSPTIDPITGIAASAAAQSDGDKELTEEERPDAVAPAAHPGAHPGAPVENLPMPEGAVVFDLSFDGALPDGVEAVGAPLVRDGAMHFDGMADFLTVAKSASPAPAAGLMRVRFRLAEPIDRKIDTNVYLWNMHRTSKFRAGLHFENRSGKLTWFNFDRNLPAVQIASDAATWEAGRWYDVVVAFDDRGTRMYVDGKMQRDVSADGRGLTNIEGASYIANVLPRFGDTYKFGGDIDLVQIVDASQQSAAQDEGMRTDTAAMVQVALDPLATTYQVQLVERATGEAITVTESSDKATFRAWTTPDGGATRYHFAIDKLDPKYDVDTVWYPTFELRPRGEPTDDYVVYPGGLGTMIEDIHHAPLEDHWGDPMILRGTYPSKLAMLQMVYYGDPSGGVMYRTDDAKRQLKEYLLGGDATRRWIRFGHYMQTTGELPYNVIEQPIDGDWYDAAQVYRAWALRQSWSSKHGRLADRSDIPAWFKVNPVWLRFTGVPWMNVDEQMEGLLKWREAAGVPMGLHWYGWDSQGGPRNVDWPAHDPPGEVFTRAVATMHANDIRVMPYRNMYIICRQSPLWDEMKDLAALKRDGAYAHEQHWGYWTTDAADIARAKAEGRTKKEQESRGKTYTNIVGDFYPACLAEEGWHETLYDRNVYLFEKHGIDASYQDQLAAGPYRCWNPKHAHKPGDPMAWRRGIEHVYDEMRRRTAAHKPVYIAEYPSEGNVGVVEGGLTVSRWLVSHHRNVPLITAVYHEQQVTIGWCNWFRYLYGGEVESFMFQRYIQLVFGSQLGWFDAHTYDAQNRIGVAKPIAASFKLRYDHAQALGLGKMLRPPVMSDVARGSAPTADDVDIVRAFDWPAILGGFFRNADGNGAVAVFANWTGQPQTATATLDLSELRGKPATKTVKLELPPYGTTAVVVE